jgi:hypothetical protein
MSPEGIVTYQVNPDVSCREEGPGEGAILFNPDIDAVLAINPTSLALWRVLAKPASRQELVKYLLANYEEVPPDQVEKDVEAFLKALLPGGFIGETSTGE